MTSRGFDATVTIDRLPSDDFQRQLDEALATRPVIEQAKGVLIATAHCTSDEAFGSLVAASQHHNVKLRDIAAAVVRLAGRSSSADARADALEAIIRSRWGDLDR